MQNRKTSCFVAVMALLGGASTVQASFVFGYSGSTVDQIGNYTLGNNFTVNSPIEVTELGVFSQDTPIAGSISIGIYENLTPASSADWTLVSGTSETISSGAALDIADQTAFINISPVKLGPGLYSVVTVTSSDYNSGFYNPSPSTVTFNNLNGALSSGSYDIWSTGTNLGGTLSGMQTTGPGTAYPWNLPVFGAGTFLATPVPEPTTVVAGVLMLFPLGASTVKILKNRRASV
jgi:hypothetical protein